MAAESASPTRTPVATWAPSRSSGRIDEDLCAFLTSVGPVLTDP